MSWIQQQETGKSCEDSDPSSSLPHDHHSLSLVIPAAAAVDREPDTPKVKLGRSAPPSPLLAARSVNGLAARQCATPPVPPRHNSQHVSTTYISQDRHTLHVTAPEQEDAKQARGFKKKDCLNPEIKINLADGKDTVNITISSEITSGPVSEYIYKTDKFKPS